VMRVDLDGHWLVGVSPDGSGQNFR
jgi:hypothetical protein